MILVLIASGGRGKLFAKGLPQLATSACTAVAHQLVDFFNQKKEEYANGLSIQIQS